MSIFDLCQRALRFQNYNMFFLKTVGSFETKFHWTYWGMEIKIYTDELGHMTKMAAMPIYGKTFKKSSPELMDR